MILNDPEEPRNQNISEYFILDGIIIKKYNTAFVNSLLAII